MPIRVLRPHADLNGLILQPLTHVPYINFANIYAHSSQQGPLDAAPADLGDTCSSANLQSVAGIAACREACAPAQCCKTNIGNANCGYAACGSYGECNALVSIVNIGVPQEENGEVDSDGGDAGNADDGVDVGDGDDVGDFDGGEDVEDEGDAKMIVDGEMTTNKPTDDGTFNDPEDGSLLGAVGNSGNTIEDTELNDYDDLFNEFIVESKGDQDRGSGEEEEEGDTVLVDRDDAAADDTANKKEKNKKGKKSKSGSGVKGKTKGSTAAASAATEAMATTDPSPLSIGQIVGIAVGGVIAFCMLIRLIKCCCCQKKLD